MNNLSPERLAETITNEEFAQLVLENIFRASSQVIDVASSYITYTALIFGALTIGLSVLSFWFHWTERKRRDTETEKAIKDIATKISKNSQFSKELVQALLEHTKMGEYIKSQVDASIQDRATDLVSEKFIAEKITECQNFMKAENTKTQGQEDDIPF